MTVIFKFLICGFILLLDIMLGIVLGIGFKIEGRIWFLFAAIHFFGFFILVRIFQVVKSIKATLDKWLSTRDHDLKTVKDLNDKLKNKDLALRIATRDRD